MENPVEEQLLDILEELGDEKLKTFHRYLQDPHVPGGFPGFPESHLETADILETVDLMVEKYADDVMKVTSLILKKIHEGKREKQIPEDLLQYSNTVVPV